MSDQVSFGLSPERAAERVAESISLRKRREKRFLFLGTSAVAVALGFLVLLFVGILSKGIPGPVRPRDHRVTR
jgi:phosphate transport system permease protein